MKTVYGYNYWPRTDEAGSGGFQWCRDASERDRYYEAHRAGLESVNASVELWHWNKWEYATDLEDSVDITTAIDAQLDNFEVAESDEDKSNGR